MTRRGDLSWRSDQLCLLIYLWLIPRLTTAGIAAAINYMTPGTKLMTRNAVIGLADRLNLPARTPARTGKPKKGRKRTPWISHRPPYQPINPWGAKS